MNCPQSFSLKSGTVRWDEWKVKAVTEPTKFPSSSSVRRIGVSAVCSSYYQSIPALLPSGQFGYGGTNSHCVLERASASILKSEPKRAHDKSNLDLVDHKLGGAGDRPHLLIFSAHDSATLQRNIEAYSQICGEVNLMDLAYTLSSRRSELSYRAFIICSTFMDVKIATAMQSIFKSTEPSPVCLVFTGAFALAGYHEPLLIDLFRSGCAVERDGRQTVPSLSILCSINQAARPVFGALKRRASLVT